MMKVEMQLKDFQNAQRAIERELSKLRSNRHVTIGIHEDAGSHANSDMTMAQLGATLNYGATINHPGGTAYGYKTAADAKSDSFKFLKAGTGYAVIGYTKPHVINIPPRPWLIPGVTSGLKAIIAQIRHGIENHLAIDDLMEGVGLVAAGAVQEYMTDLKTPPNARSTIAAKGSDNPLINTGALRGSVTSKVTTQPLEEGI